MPGRTIAIGDIHGCTVALDALLAAIRPQASDTLIMLGDYIDRGPDSRGCIDRMLELGRRTRLVPIMGNHDKMLLGLLEGKEHTFANWLALGGNATLDSFACTTPEAIPSRYLDFLADCVPWYETARHLFVHANYLPDLPLDEQPLYALRWESLKVRCPGPHFSGKTAIVGHTSQKSGRVLDLGHLKCIDTACYAGGWLTALDIDSDTLWQANQSGQLRSNVRGETEKREETPPARKVPRASPLYGLLPPTA